MKEKTNDRPQTVEEFLDFISDKLKELRENTLEVPAEVEEKVKGLLKEAFDTGSAVGYAKGTAQQFSDFEKSRVLEIINCLYDMMETISGGGPKETEKYKKLYQMEKSVSANFCYQRDVALGDDFTGFCDFRDIKEKTIK